MTLRIYAVARWKFATQAWSWIELGVQARLYGADYVANIENDTVVPAGFIDSTQVTNKTTNNKGYCSCGTIYFDNVVPTQDITQLVIFANTLGTPMFHEFIVPIKKSTTPRPVYVLLGGTGWLFRL